MDKIEELSKKLSNAVKNKDFELIKKVSEELNDYVYSNITYPKEYIRYEES